MGPICVRISDAQQRAAKCSPLPDKEPSMAFAIVTDSSSNLTEEVIDQFDLHILPLTFMVDGEEHHSYLKGQKTDLKDRP